MRGVQPRRPPAGLWPRRSRAAGLGTPLGTAASRDQGPHRAASICVAFSPDGRTHRLRQHGPTRCGFGTRPPASPGSPLTDTPTRSAAWSSRPTARPSFRAASTARSRPGTLRPGSSGTFSEATPRRFTTWRFSPDGRTLASAASTRLASSGILAAGQPRRDTPWTYRRASTPWRSALTAAPSRRRPTTTQCGCGTPPLARLEASWKGISTRSTASRSAPTAVSPRPLWTRRSGSGTRPAGRRLLTLKGHAGRIRRIKFSPDGRTLASASYDRTLKLWEAAPAAALAADKSEAAVHDDSDTAHAKGPPRTIAVEDRRSLYATDFEARHGRLGSQRPPAAPLPGRSDATSPRTKPTSADGSGII